MAGNRIKGITVEIGGDTTKLQTALKGVNTEIRNTQSQLRDVEKLLKLDPGNTELIAQKHRLLAQAVSETREKLETLKTAQQQADEALRNGTISQDQYDALQREIVETEQRLRSLEEKANQSATALQKIGATGEKLQTVGNKISSVGQKLLPVTGVAADMVISPQMAAADSGVITGTGTSGGADLTAGIVAALKDVLGDQKEQQGDLVIPVYLGNQLLDEVIVTAQQRMSLRSGGR